MSNVDICNTDRDLWSKSKFNSACNLKTYANSIEKQTNANSSTFTMQTKHINSPKYNAFIRRTGLSIQYKIHPCYMQEM